MTETERDGARHLAHDHRLVGGPKPRRGRNRHLELAWAVFRQEGIGRRARLTNRGH